MATTTTGGLASASHIRSRPKFVARGGYGIFYGLKDQNQQTTQFSDNPPNIPLVSLPNVSAAQTVTPPFTMNTPIQALPVSTDLSGFSAANPLGTSFRTQAFNHAGNPMLQQYNSGSSVPAHE